MDEEIKKKIANSYELPNNVLNAVPNPRVSIQLVTYNHIDFFKDSIESILMQQVDFPYEIVIGEDFSTDGTRELVLEYAKKYPNLIRVITADYNVKQKANRIRSVKACRGDYVAFMDGDDYWTDPLKLQKQFDFMEKHINVYLCWHSYRTKIKGKLSEKLYPEFPSDYTGDELLSTPGYIIYDAMFIKNIFLNNKEEVSFDFIGHYKLIAMLGTYGNGKFLKDIGPTIYVHHSGGQWTARDPLSKRYAVLQIRLDVVNYLLEKRDYRRVEIAIVPLKEKIESLLSTSNNKLSINLNSNLFYLSYRGIKLEFVYGPIVRKIKRIFKKTNK